MNCKAKPNPIQSNLTTMQRNKFEFNRRDISHNYPGRKDHWIFRKFQSLCTAWQPIVILSEARWWWHV